MLGWEFPPYFTGGVGTVCHALTKKLVEQGHKVLYIMPRGPEKLKEIHPYLNIRIADNEVLKNVTIKGINSLLTIYEGYDDYLKNYSKFMLKGAGSSEQMYGENLLLEVERFAQKALAIALQEDFDVIHAHDWTTFKAGMLIKEVTGKPLIVHVHITEFDKTGGHHADSRVYAIEREGMMKSDLIIAISNFVKNMIVNKYYVPAEKIRVVHNGIDLHQIYNTEPMIKPYDKIVLSLGRVTLQKGVDYLIEAARKVINKDPNVKFIIAGTGDMLPQIIEKAAHLGISDKVLFTGFVTREQGEKLFQAADVFVMPSVSEPFGLVPLEALNKGTPVIISKQSGVAEVLKNSIKIDFWDVDALAGNILAMLHYKTLHKTMSEYGGQEVRKLTWDEPTRKCVQIYDEAINMTRGRKGRAAW